MLPALILMLMFGQKFYSDDPIVRDRDNQVDVTEIKKYKLNDQYDFFKLSFSSPGDRSMRPAANANTLGEVPASSWFQNRHGMSAMSLSALTKGPNTGNGPSNEASWVIIDAKTEGVTPGFRIRDARGDIYFVKFDPIENPEMSTAAEVISTKFFYAIGYNVPENYITFFKRDQLQIDDKAKISEEQLDNLLKRVYRSRDGVYRAVA